MIQSGPEKAYAQHMVASEKDGCVYIYVQMTAAVSNSMGIASATLGQTGYFGMVFNSQTDTWTNLDPVSPLRFPGIYTTSGYPTNSIKAHSIVRFDWDYQTRGSSQHLWWEHWADTADDPLMNTGLYGPLPGDGYPITLTQFSGQSFTVAITNGGGLGISGGLFTTVNGTYIMQTIGGVRYFWSAVNSDDFSGRMTLTAMGGAPATPNNGDAYEFLACPFIVEWQPFNGGDDASAKLFNLVSLLLESGSTASAVTVQTASEIQATFSGATSSIAQLCIEIHPAKDSARCRKFSVRVTNVQAGRFCAIAGIQYDFRPHSSQRSTE
jgi:hypothetical protein